MKRIVFFITCILLLGCPSVNGHSFYGIFRAARHLRAVKHVDNFEHIRVMKQAQHIQDMDRLSHAELLAKKNKVYSRSSNVDKTKKTNAGKAKGIKAKRNKGKKLDKVKTVQVGKNKRVKAGKRNHFKTKNPKLTRTKNSNHAKKKRVAQPKDKPQKRSKIDKGEHEEKILNVIDNGLKVLDKSRSVHDRIKASESFDQTHQNDK